MLTQKVIIQQIETNHIHCSCQRLSSCTGCSSRQNCTIATINKALPSQQFITLDKNRLQSDFSITLLNTGDLVTLEFPEQSMLQLTVYAYLLPLLSLVIATLGAHGLNHYLHLGEWFTILVTISSFGLAIIGSRHLARRIDNNSNYRVKISLT